MDDFLAEARKWAQKATGAAAPEASAAPPHAAPPPLPASMVAAEAAAPGLPPAYEAALQAGKLFEQVAALTATVTAERDRADAAEARCIALEQALERHAADGKQMEAQLASLGGAVRDELSHMAADLEASQARVTALQALVVEKEAETAVVRATVSAAQEAAAAAKGEAEAATAAAAAERRRAEASAAEAVAAAQVAAATAEREAAAAVAAQAALASKLAEAEATIAALQEQADLWRAENDRVRADNDRLRQEVHLAAAAAAVVTVVGPSSRPSSPRPSGEGAHDTLPSWSPSPRGRSASASGAGSREHSHTPGGRLPWRPAQASASLSQPPSASPSRSHTPRRSLAATVPEAAGFATSTDIAKSLYGRPSSPGRMLSPSEGGWGHRTGGVNPAVGVAGPPMPPPPPPPAPVEEREATMLAMLAAAKAREAGLLEALAERDNTMAALIEGVASVKAAAAPAATPPPPPPAAQPALAARQVFFEVLPAAGSSASGADVDALPSAGLVRVIDRGSHRIYKAHDVTSGSATVSGSGDRRPALGWATAAAEALRAGALPGALLAIGGTPAAAAAAGESACGAVVAALLGSDGKAPPPSLSVSLLDVRGDTVRDVLALRRAKPTDADAAPSAHRSGSGVAYAAPLLLTTAPPAGSSSSSACPALDDATRVAVSRPEEALVVIRTGLTNRGLLYADPGAGGWEGGAAAAAASVYGPHRGHAVLALHVCPAGSATEAVFFIVLLGLPGWVASTSLRAAAEAAADLGTLPPASLAVQLQLDAAAASQGIAALGDALEALAQLSVAGGEGRGAAAEAGELRAALAAAVADSALTRVLAPALLLPPGAAGKTAAAAPVQSLLVSVAAHMPYATDADAVAFLLMGNDVTQRQLIPELALPQPLAASAAPAAAAPATVDLSLPFPGGLTLPQPLVSPRGMVDHYHHQQHGGKGGAASGGYVPNPATVAELQAAAAAHAYAPPQAQAVSVPHTPSTAQQRQRSYHSQQQPGRSSSGGRSGDRHRTARRPSGSEDAGSATAFNPPSPVFSSVSQQARRFSYGSGVSTAIDIASLLDGRVLQTPGGPLAVNAATQKPRDVARARSASRDAEGARGRGREAGAAPGGAATRESSGSRGGRQGRAASPPSPSFPAKTENLPLKSQFISVEAYLARGGPASASASIVSADTLKRAAAAGGDKAAPRRSRSRTGADSVASLGSSALTADMLRSVRAAAVAAGGRLPPHAEEAGGASRRGSSVAASAEERQCPESPPVSPAALGIRVPWEDHYNPQSLSGKPPSPMSLQPAAAAAGAGPAGLRLPSQPSRSHSASRPRTTTASAGRGGWLQGGVTSDSLSRLNAFVGSVAEDERRRVAAARAGAATAASSTLSTGSSKAGQLRAGSAAYRASAAPPVAALPLDDLDAAIAAELRVQQQLAAADAALAAVAASAATRATGATAFAATLTSSSTVSTSAAVPPPVAAPAPASVATEHEAPGSDTAPTSAATPPPLSGDPVPGMRRLLHALDGVTGPLTTAVFKQLLEVLGAGDAAGGGYVSEATFTFCLHRFLPELSRPQIEALVQAMHMTGLPLIDYRDFVQALAALAHGDGLLLGH